VLHSRSDIVVLTCAGDGEVIV
jgi:hypothetical protein